MLIQLKRSTLIIHYTVVLEMVVPLDVLHPCMLMEIHVLCHWHADRYEFSKLSRL